MSNSATFGITCFNAEDTIARAIESALAQDHSDFKIIVVDDASTDNSAHVLKTYAEKYPDKISVILKETNGGVAASRNKIIEHSNSDFIVFFDDDDISYPSRARTQIQRIIDYEKHHAAGAPVICHCARIQVYPDGKRHLEKPPGTLGGIAPHGDDMASHILFNKFIEDGAGSLPTCVQAGRTTHYQSVGGFDESFRRSEDTEFNLRFAMAGGHFAGCADPLVEQTMTLADDKKFSAERDYTKKIYTKHAAYLQNKGRGTFDIGWLDIKYDYLERQYLSLFKNLARVFISHPLLALGRLYHALPNFGYNSNVKRLNKP